MNINLIRIINNYKDYSYFYKSLNKLILYKSNFTTFPSFLKIIIIKFSFEILLVDKAISIAKSMRLKE
ncbi:hypothetical protein C8034_v004029 [Colletotrichum sidae]|uniref:Uncharacterized protein n=1 Tax=Colletotrichum sidae TaxID=1347389 RepID=A0A4R8S7P3_9PEZI|nr:hypothetical protein C8034_v004029 [Colletotrichum sidae]